MNAPDPCGKYLHSEESFYHDLVKERSEAFSCLYLRTYQLCLPYALGKGSDQDLAEDLLQECLAIFVQKIRGGSYAYQDGVKITTYFYRIYMNQWKKAYERQSKRGEVRLMPRWETDSDEEPYKEAGLGSPFVAILRGEEQEEEHLTISEEVLRDYDEDERSWIYKKLDRAYRLLSEDCQNVLTWFYVEDWPLRQIAEALGMTEASATVKRFKCAKYLKEKFRLA
jgi:RNA polymerase sigma factor (sigma-70 family)